MATEPDPTTPKAPCATCGGTGQRKRRRLVLLSGRGANFYRHGGYSNGTVQRTPAGPEFELCPDCASEGAAK